MTETLIREQIERAVARAKKATPGPWRYWPNEGDTGDVRVCQDGGGRCVCCVALMGDVNAENAWTPETVAQWQANAEFIAASRTDVPGLAVTALALMEENERLRDELAFYADPANYRSHVGTEGYPHIHVWQDKGERACNALLGGDAR